MRQIARTPPSSKGRKLPLIGQIEIAIIEESNPRLLAFQRGSLDFVAVPIDLVPNVLDPDNKLKPDLAKQGIRLYRDVQPAISYLYFNMEDPVIGGYTPDRIALRRAIAMAYNIDDDIRVLRQGQGAVATQIIPPGMSGHDPTLDVRIRYDVRAARALLDKFGYKDRDGDGFRETPDGKPLTIALASPPSTQDRQGDELWKRSLDALNLRVEFVKQKWPDLLKAARLGQLQAWRLGNINTTPEGFGFHGLLYSKHAGFSNLARFNRGGGRARRRRRRCCELGDPGRRGTPQRGGERRRAHAPARGRRRAADRGGRRIERRCEAGARGLVRLGGGTRGCGGSPSAFARSPTPARSARSPMPCSPSTPTSSRSSATARRA